MNNSVYLIVLNWNGSEDTIECIKSIKKNDYPDYNIVIVDNGSEKDSLEELKSWCKRNFSRFVAYTREQAESGGISSYEDLLNITRAEEKLIFIENNENLGFAAGNNVALKYTLKIKATYAMLLNNDTVIEKDSISKLMEFLRSNGEFVAVTPQIRYFEPNDRIWNCGGKIMWFGNRKYYFAENHISKVPKTGYKRITYITGCALLFKPNITGILTEKFFFGEEDLDFSFRQKQENRKMACCYPSIIYHKVNASVKKVNVRMLGYVYIHYLSRLINNRQYSSKIMFLIKIILNLGYAIPMIHFRYRISYKQIFNMLMKILKELKRIDKIDKEYFFKSLKEDFSY